MAKRQTAAVIGSGISGLMAAYLLQRQHDVTLYEANDRLGGHTHTHTVSDSGGQTQSVDTGFIVHNIHTYPNLLRLFKELDIKTKPTEMSMSIACRECGLEFAGAKGWSGILATPNAPLRPRYVKLLLTVKRFYKDALALLDKPDPGTQTLDEFMRRGKYGRYFETHYILPIISAVWSCDLAQAREYPAEYLFRFLDNHRMLQTENMLGNDDWRVVSGGSNSYVKKIEPLLHKVVLNTEVTGVERKNGLVIVSTKTGKPETFAKAVIATHPDQALRLLAKATKTEREVLGAFHYTQTQTLLHTDTSILPRYKRAQASWNYLKPTCDGNSNIRVSYDMNRLQHIDSSDRYIVSLDSVEQVDPDKILDRMEYQHPLFTPESVAAQARLHELNDDLITFAGAYHGWGFHEDGCRSGVQAAAALGVDW